ncbi:MAG: outer membrane lipoprotein-sorting protein [Bacteroidetes bacterium]|nr:outer membrane lipoprotein-sorting protein [Bacteroidota bacterium]
MKRILFAFLFIAAATAVFGQTADEIINKHIEAIGGAEAWKKVNSVKMEGTIQVQGAELAVTITVLNGKGARQDLSIMGMTGYQIVTPAEGWNYMPFQGQTTPEAMTAEDLAESQDDLDAQGNLIDYAAKGHTVELLGKDDVEGTECYKLKITKKGGKSETIYVDPKSHLILRSVEIRKANGQEIEVATNYSNYEKLPEGIIVPKSMTLPFGELILSKITINGDVDETAFKK